MNGPEHYRAAEQLLNDATELLQEGESPKSIANVHQRAQVHATLALAAATALTGYTDPNAGVNEDETAWVGVASVVCS